MVSEHHRKTTSLDGGRLTRGGRGAGWKWRGTMLGEDSHPSAAAAAATAQVKRLANEASSTAAHLEFKVSNLTAPRSAPRSVSIIN